MEVAGLALAVLAEARTIANSLIARIGQFRDAPKRFAAACASVTRLIVIVEDIDEVGKNNSVAFPVEIVQLFNLAVSCVYNSLVNMGNRLEEYSVSSVATGVYIFFFEPTLSVQ